MKFTVKEIFDNFLNSSLDFKKLPIFNDQGLYNLFTKKLGIKNQDLLIVLEELLINSQEHGDGQPDLYYDSSNNMLSFIVLDKGPGIHNTLPANPRLSDTKGKTTTSVLRLSLEEGISGTGKIGRGMGLYYLSQFVKNYPASSLTASDSGYILQSSNKFKEVILTNDIGTTLIILQVTHQGAGL